MNKLNIIYINISINPSFADENIVCTMPSRLFHRQTAFPGDFGQKLTWVT